MSERYSFVTEYIYDYEDYKTLKNVLSKCQDKYLCVMPPAKWNNGIEDLEMPIIAGKIGSDYSCSIEPLENALDGVITKNIIVFAVIIDVDCRHLVNTYCLENGELYLHNYPFEEKEYEEHFK